MSTAHRRISVSDSGAVAVVRFVDRKIVDESQVGELGAELFDLVDKEKRRAILLNFTGVEFISSAALGKLITLDRRVKTAKARMKLSDVCPEIMEVFEITKLSRMFDIRGSEAEALAAF